MDYLSGDGKRQAKMFSIKDKYEKIDYMDWLFDSRSLHYKLTTVGFNYGCYKLEVRWLSYKNRTYAFDLNFGLSFDSSLNLLIEEDKIISEYHIALDEVSTNELLEEILKLQVANLGSNCNDECDRAIINFLNDAIINGKAFHRDDHYTDINFDPWWLDDENDYMATLRKEYKSGDLVKIIDSKKGITKYGKLIYHTDENQIGFYKCYLIDEEANKDETCYKYFLLFDRNYSCAGKEVKKADISELNDKQKKLFEEI